MDRRRFLREYWQKKPLLVRGAFPRFRDPLTPEELAGLACEDGVESRLVERSGKRWAVEWGPHPEARFSELPEKNWTLLVQEVNRWVPRAALMLEDFTFIPNVRVDDVMVSFAAPGGGVGPHVDSYDVFLIQGHGERRWQFHSKPTRDRRLVPGLDLRVLAKFEPDVDEVLGPGDMLYLPPGFAHHGTAVMPCLTYSIGFRAPRAGEMWAAYAASQASLGEELLTDPPLSPTAHPGEIPKAMRERVRAMVRSIDLSDASIDRWFASYATRLKPGHTFEAPRRPPGAREISTRLRRGDVVVRSEEGRWAFLGNRLFVGGEEIALTKETLSLARALCSARRHEGLSMSGAASRDLLVRLFAMGALSFAPKR
jgi:50S ribosomal protein L16 3-hydroxylase